MPEEELEKWKQMKSKIWQIIKGMALVRGMINIKKVYLLAGLCVSIFLMSSILNILHPEKRRKYSRNIKCMLSLPDFGVVTKLVNEFLWYPTEQCGAWIHFAQF